MKLLKILLLVLLAFLISEKTVLANEDFDVSVSASYDIDNELNTQVQLVFHIKNKKTEKYIPEIVIDLGNVKAENIQALQDGKKIITNILSEYKFSLTPFPVVGSQKEFQILVKYTSKDLVYSFGKLKEAKIPSYLDNFYLPYEKVTIQYDKMLGEIAYTDPGEYEKISDENKIKLVFEKPLSKYILLGFGKHQDYSLELLYHLENNSSFFKKEIIISAPPDTYYQKIFLDKIDPKPHDAYLDNDGNWIYSYILKPKSRLDVSIIAQARIFSEKIAINMEHDDYLQSLLKSTKEWPTQNESIKKTSAQLKNPREIYDYVVKNFSYAKDISLDDQKRLGAVEAIKKKNNLICLDFTDILISFLRSEGYPSRELVGYAYSENKQSYPLSLISDVMHSWVDYWDVNDHEWKMIDPTWANTSGGSYYDFNDLRHIVFTIHGENPEYPKAPGFYKLSPQPQKDVFVNISEVINEIENYNVNTKKSNKLFSFFPSLVVYIENNGNTALYSKEIKIKKGNEEIRSESIGTLIPNQTISYEVPLTLDLLLYKKNISYEIDGEIKLIEIKLSDFNYLWIKLVFIITFIIFLIRSVKFIFNRKKILY